MDESEDRTTNAASSRCNIDYERNSISEGFNSISKMQNQEFILNQMNQSSVNSSSMYKVNLAAALHDHISCTKLQPDLCRSNDGLFTLNLNSLSRQHKQNETMEEEKEFTNFFGEQDDTFKDIILVQLDLIQHQQEQLLKKERQLQSARQDCEALYKRVDSMEREIMNLKEQLTKKEENRQQNNENTTYLELNKDSSDCLDNQLTFCNFLTDPSNLLTTSSNVYQTSDQFHLNKSPLSSIHQPSKHFNRSTEEIEQLNVNNLESTFSRIDDNRKRKKTKINDESKDDKKTVGTGSKKKLSNSTVKKVSDKSITVNNKKSGDKPKNSQSNNSTLSNTTIEHQAVEMPIKTIETDYPYEIVTNKDFFNSLDDEDEITEAKSNQSNIEIPSWRVYPISCSYSLEGTECLHDDMFTRRHSKLELDEKRRKRWELQRLRELKNNERLRSGRYSSKQIVVNNTNSTTSSSQFTNNDNTNDIASFYPAPNIHLKYIEITDKLPVVAFGQPIPDLKKPNNFQLPWNKNTKSSKSSKVTNSKKS